jgi:hypothetical protein
MTDREKDPPQVGMYYKAVRMFRVGISQFEFARLDPDGSIFVKLDELDKWGSYRTTNSTVRRGDVGYDRISAEHELTKSGDGNVIEKKLVDGQWVILSKPPTYRWAWLTENGDVLVEFDPDSQEWVSSGTARHADLCQQHDLIKVGDNSVIELE